MLKFTRRLALLIRRRRRARQMGLAFHRAAAFATPTAVTLHGTTYELRLPDQEGAKGAFIELFFDDCYHCSELACSGFVPATVLDIGANAGLFSLQARSKFPGALIHAYEPNPEMFPYLQNQASQAHFEYFMEAVGDASGHVSLSQEADSVYTRVCDSSGGNVRQTAFATCIARMGGRVDYLKIDCEGGEWSLFRDRESWSAIRYVAMEYHLWEGHQLIDLFTTVDALGFEVLDHQPMGDVGLVFLRSNTVASQANSSGSTVTGTVVASGLDSRNLR